MARAKSEDKRLALLSAAIDVFAEEGLSARTAKIARRAGVAEGTLFTYFETKDELFNQLYLHLKGELYQKMIPAYPEQADLKTQVKHIWRAYVEWGVESDNVRQVMRLLVLSPYLNEQTKAEGTLIFKSQEQLLNRLAVETRLYDYPKDFLPALIRSSAEMTMDLMLLYPDQAEEYAEAGFASFWRGICKE